MNNREGSDDWIKPDDEELIDSIVRHEGGKEVIYQYIKKGVLPVAKDCDAEYCMEEGLWPAYVDTEGLDTVGIGHLINGKESYDPYAGIDDDTVMQQLAEDIETHLEGAKKLAKTNGMDNIGGNYTVQRFMTEMCFNIGAGGYSKFKNGLKKLASAVNQDGEWTYNDAADEHLNSGWAKQVKSRADEMTDTLRHLD
jgi:GH24 family phage-related lysozyme (muramidase)